MGELCASILPDSASSIGPTPKTLVPGSGSGPAWVQGSIDS